MAHVLVLVCCTNDFTPINHDNIKRIAGYGRQCAQQQAAVSLAKGSSSSTGQSASPLVIMDVQPSCMSQQV
jgi:hypothetical protein